MPRKYSKAQKPLNPKCMSQSLLKFSMDLTSDGYGTGIIMNRLASYSGGILLSDSVPVPDAMCSDRFNAGNICERDNTLLEE